MYIKLLVITATLILLAAFTSKSDAGVEGEIDTQEVRLNFRLEQGISVTPVLENDGKFTEGQLNRGQKIATMTFQLASDVSYLALRWVDARTNPKDTKSASIPGLDPANVIWLTYAKSDSGDPAAPPSGDYWIYATNGVPTLYFYISSARDQNVRADVYTIKIEATAWEL